MAKYVLGLLVVEDDNSSYQMAWHITDEFYAELRGRVPEPHGEWVFTAEDNAKRKTVNEGIGIGVIHDVP